VKTDQDPPAAPKLHAVPPPPNGERWHCPDPYATELAAAREGGRAYLAHLSAAIGVFLTTGDPASVVAMLADLWKAAAALATDEVALASWGHIDAQLEAHRATLRERALLSLRHKRQVTAERASLAMEIVTQAMKGGISEEGAFRLLDRVATPLWRVAPDENGEHVTTPEGDRETKPADVVMALIDQARKWVEGKLKAEAEAADLQARAMAAMAAQGVPLQPIGVHVHGGPLNPHPMNPFETSAPLVLKLVAVGALAYDGVPDAEDGKLPPPIVHPEVWAKVEPVLAQLGAELEVLGTGDRVAVKEPAAPEPGGTP
jgi:hypothetical protein